MRYAVLPLLLALHAGADDLITLAADVRERDGAWTFAVEGKARLVDGASLDVQVLLPHEVTYRSGETYRYEDTVAEGKAVVSGGGFSAAIGRMPHRPYSMAYVLRATLTPSEQPRDVREDLERRDVPLDKPVSRDAEVVLGTPADLEREHVEADKAVIADFQATRALFEEIEARFKSLYVAGGAADLAAWDAWRKEWDGRRRPIEESNTGRIAEDLYWRESYGRRYLEAILEGLSELADFYREVLATPAAERPPQEQVARAGKIFEAKYWERLDFLQIVLIARPAEVLRLVDKVEARVRRVSELRALAAKKDPAFSAEAWEKEATDARVAFAQLPAGLSAELPETYFGLVAGLTRDLLALLGPPEGAVDIAPIAEALSRLRKDAGAQGK